MDLHSPGAAYHLWYVPISLCTDISSIRELVDPPVGRQKGFSGHQRGALRPLGLTIYPQEAGSERWVYLIFHTSVVLIRKYFSIHTFTYLSTGHLTRSLRIHMSHPITRRFPLHFHHFSSTFITLLVVRCLDPTAHGIIQENFSRVSITSGDLLNVHSLSHW